MINKMIFFDFDYTLAKTVENVWVWSPRGTRFYNKRPYRVVNPLEYGMLKLADDESLDEDSFKEFNKLNVEKAKPIELNLFLLNYFMSNKNNFVTILSARPQAVENHIFDFLKQHNVVNYKNILFKGCDSSDPSLKYKFIKEKVLKHKPKEVFLFDDSKKVIDYAKANHSIDFNKLKFTICLVKNKNSSTCLCF
jgi:hypothetical protein